MSLGNALERGIYYSPDTTGGGDKPSIKERINDLKIPAGVKPGNFGHAQGLLAILEEAEKFRKKNPGDERILSATTGVITNYPKRIRDHIEKGTLPLETSALLEDILNDEEELKEWRE